MTLRTHNLPSERQKNLLGEFDKAMVQGVELQCEIIFWIPGIQKRNMNVVR
jgi:hypothetical protein